ncbi:MAG: hypothetical protein J6V44_15680 [Methanobrevibacter sp.]|nr:hypothetical protein [Methanobrevibacter sp.]MBO7692149.1 hypothetical protein [Methanobrevibacter sp.]
MQKYTMTVHEGLAELKILGQRIEKELASNAFIMINKHANTKIDGMSIADCQKVLKASMQKVNDLINRRNAIKQAITKSNAVTEITLTKDNGNSVTMTVAEVIEYKNVGIMYLEKLLSTLSSQYARVTREMKLKNDALTQEADRYVVGLFGSKDGNGISADVIENSRNSYIEANTIDLIDPNKVMNKINDLKEELDFYNTKVDAALSTSNAVTTIEFEV